jgi:hypothetical protein
MRRESQRDFCGERLAASASFGGCVVDAIASMGNPVALMILINTALWPAFTLTLWSRHREVD